MDKLLEKDYVVRIMALLIAVLLWFQATSAQNPIVERDLDDVAVRIQNIEAGFTVVGSVSPDTVEITLSGAQHLVSALTADNQNERNHHAARERPILESRHKKPVHGERSSQGYPDEYP